MLTTTAAHRCSLILRSRQRDMQGLYTPGFDGFLGSFAFVTHASDNQSPKSCPFMVVLYKPFSVGLCYADEMCRDKTPWGNQHTPKTML